MSSSKIFSQPYFFILLRAISCHVIAATPLYLKSSTVLQFIDEDLQLILPSGLGRKRTYEACSFCSPHRGQVEKRKKKNRIYIIKSLEISHLIFQRHLPSLQQFEIRKSLMVPWGFEDSRALRLVSAHALRCSCP
ncbi:hypothetical protein CEXT_647871 [Caerostris extrusa]|uniref:Secreted protein n=1 Tax=Caerostris extrusa TaxID=172846 RepID=A0AAV4RPN5_CAEEX|nr:hypothetical protein CEXT_647871 [Caerostris extrusa]